MIDTGGATDPREELAELAASIRAYVEWQADTGASGLPSETAPPAALAGTGAAAPMAPAPAPRSPAPTATAAAAPSWPVSPARPAVGPAMRLAEASVTPSPPPAVGPPPPALAMVEVPKPPQAQAPAPATAPRDAGTDERRTRLALLAEEVRSCTRCALHETRQQTVFSRGDPFAELVFIGEGPGADEDAQGEPFVGPAGQLLDRMIAAMGYRRDEVYIANIVKCRPPSNRKPEPAEMAACLPFLTQQVTLVKPRVLVALGATAMQGLCGTTEGITRLRGKWKLYKGSIPIMPTFHPAYLLRNPAAKRDVWSDLQDVMKHLGKPTGKP